MTVEGKVTTERHGQVLLIGLDRVAKRNAFDRAMLDALAKAYGELDRDQNLRCGVLFAPRRPPILYRAPSGALQGPVTRLALLWPSCSVSISGT